MPHCYSLFRVNTPPPDSPYTRALALWRELLAMEKRLRQIADETTNDARMAASADMGADYVQRAANRVAEREGFEEF